MRNRDLEHLRLLSTFHYVLAGIVFLFSLVPIFHVLLGFSMIRGDGFFGDFFPTGHGHGQFPPSFGWFFVIMGGTMIVLGMTLSILLLFAGGCLRRTSGYTFTKVVAFLSCLYVPIGTALGVFTIIVLSRESVRELYGLAPAPSPGGPPPLRR